MDVIARSGSDVAIRTPATKGGAVQRTARKADSHDQFANWSRNDVCFITP